MGARYFKTVATKTRRETSSSLQDPISSFTNHRTLQRGEQWSPIVGRCLALPLRDLIHSCNRKKSFFKVELYKYSFQSAFHQNQELLRKGIRIWSQ